MAIIDYKPARTVKHFIKHHKPHQFFADWIIGPVGSGKTTGVFFKLVYLASQQTPSPVDGKRRVRAVIVRNTAPQLSDTTIASWNLWFKDGVAGKWHATDKRFVLRFSDVECEVLFRALDTPDDVARVLSLETTFVILDEFVQIPEAIVDALAARCGRYPAQNDGGATNWGMWGASNPGNEDDWWHDKLLEVDKWTGEKAVKTAEKETNWTYFEQPSGFSEEAENLENLPGGREYYTNLAKDKKEHWVKQFIEVEWGYSLQGTPVIATFNYDIHVAKQPLKANSHLPLIGGYDPGMNSAMILGQMDLHGRVCVFDELIQRDMGAVRFVTTRLQPLIRLKYPAFEFIISPDPAAGQRTQTDEQTVVKAISKYFKVKIADSNNRLAGRIEAIEHYTTRLTDSGPALLIDPRCKTLIRALRSGWRYAKTQKGEINPEPMKNEYSHPGDAFSYMCKYFYKGMRNETRRREVAAVRQAPMNTYHIR
jgi:hypothetical protein